MPRASVIIPSWNGAHLLPTALQSLARQEWNDFEIIVVDNGSTDETLELLDERFSHVRQIGLVRNVGFAAAVNAGIAAATGEIIVLMNNDTEAAPGWIGSLVAALDRHPEVGSCASKMLDFRDRSMIDGIGDQMALRAAPIARGRPDGAEFSRERHVFSACAGAAAYRRALFEDVGVFDERYFAYLEDVDLGFRAQLAGYRCLFVPGAVIYHLGGATSDRMSETRSYWLVRNSLFLFFQNMPGSLIWRHGWFMIVWPFADAIRHRRNPRPAIRGWLAFWADLPAVIRRRRRAHARRRITAAELRSLLSLPQSRFSKTRAGRAAGSTVRRSGA